MNDGMRMVCRRCKERAVPAKYASPRVCAFRSGKFLADNWNCETINDLRDLAEEGSAEWRENAYRTRYDDESVAVLAIPEDVEGTCGAFLVLHWYKNRGGCDGAYITGDPPEPLTLEQAESILSAWLPPPHTGEGR